MARFNASKLRSAVSRYNSAVSRYNSAVRSHNASVRRALADYNRRVRAFNSQVRELQRQLTLLRHRTSVRTYEQLLVEMRTVVVHQERTLVIREHEWDLLDGSEQASLQQAAMHEDVELMLVDSEGNEL